MAKLANPMDKYVDWQINALHSVLIGDEPFFYRKMCRYISQKFNISLLEAEKLPVDYILLHYFESQYEEWEEKDLIKLAKELCAPDIADKEEEQIQAVIDELDAEYEQQEEQKKDKKESLELPKMKEFDLKFEE